MIWLFLSCQPHVSVEDSSTDYPYLIEEDDQQVDIDLQRLSSHLEEVLPNIRSYSVQPYIETYLQLVEQNDESCPSWGVNQEGQQYWYDYCYTADGYGFEGSGLAPIEYEQFSNEYGQTITGHAFWGVGKIESPNGAMISINGGIQYLHGFDEGGGNFFSTYIDSGSHYSSDGGTSIGPSPQLNSYAYTIPSNGNFIQINGLYPVSYTHLTLPTKA